MKRLVLVGALGFVVSCGSPPTEPISTRAGQPAPSASAELSCGDVVLAQGEELAVAGPKEVACLERALRESRRAALTVTAPTVEGDPIVTSWHLGADGLLGADIDSSKDRYAGAPLSRVSCGRITELPNPLTCEESG